MCGNKTSAPVGDILQLVKEKILTLPIGCQFLSPGTGSKKIVQFGGAGGGISIHSINATTYVLSSTAFFVFFFKICVDIIVRLPIFLFGFYLLKSNILLVFLIFFLLSFIISRGNTFEDRESTYHEKLHQGVVTCICVGRVGRKDFLGTGTEDGFFLNPTILKFSFIFNICEILIRYYVY